MSAIRVAVLRAAGTNCDQETLHAWTLAGARADLLHLEAAIASPDRLDPYAILTLPGGFSFGDDIAAGRIFAARLGRHLRDRMLAAIDAERLIFGICNGFQILVKTGLLPDVLRGRTWSEAGGCTVTFNEQGGYLDRWVTLEADRETPCAFLEPGRTYELPIAHGEGRVVFSDAETLERVRGQHLDALRYAVPVAAGSAGGDLPANPNGSVGDIAGLCDATGRVFGLMPHPERFVDPTQHPCWTSRPGRGEGDGLAMFRAAVERFR